MLFRTAEADGHYHVGYLGVAGGVTSSDSGHFHTFGPKEPDSPADPSAGVLVCSPGTDGHVHEIEGELTTDSGLGKPKKEDKESKVAEVRRLFKNAIKNEEDSRKIAEESEEFYNGEQWADEDKEELKKQKRACLTLNEIESKVDLLSGYQRQNRSDIKFLPVEEGDSRVADVLNVLVKNICDQNNFEFEETHVFEDGLIAGRGFFHVYIDNDKNLEGDIKIESWPWRDGYLGPHRRPDLADCEYLFKSKWFSEAKAQQMFPDKWKEIRSEYAPYFNDDGMDEIRTAGEPEHGASGSTDYPDYNRQVPDPDFVNISNKQVRLLECWRRQYDRVNVAVVPADGFYQNLTGLKKSEMSMLKTIPALRVVERQVDKIRKTVVVASALISDEFVDLYTDFPLIPFYAKMRDGKFWGKVHGVKDPQREINKRHSQYTDILNKVAAYGWFYDDNTFLNRQDEQAFKGQSAKPGFTQKVKSTQHPPVQVEGVKFPNEVVALAEVSSQKLREILNINPELLGLNSKSESGVAQVEKKRQGLIGNEFLFDNLDRAKKTLGRVLIRMIQKLYTPERILRVLESAASRAAVQVGKAAYDPSRMAEIQELLANADLGKYDVAVTESAFSPTQRRANFVAWGDLARNGFPVPPELLIDLSDLPEKDKVKEAMAAQAQAQKEAEERKYQAEIEKTRIAKGAPGTSS